MASRAEILFGVAPSGLIQYTGGGVQYMVQTPTGDQYAFYVDQNSDLAYRKSTDNGLTWSQPPVVLLTGTIVAYSIWYDKWSGLSTGLIHAAYIDGADSDTKYITIDTASSDAVSTQTVIFAGVSSAGGGTISIARSRGGNVYCYNVIDAGVEGGFFRLPNANVPNGAWDAARTNPEALANTDQLFLAPGFAADNQDMLAIYWDASANEVSRYIYDDSANTWAETSINASMTDTVASSSFPHLAITVDLTNNQLIMVAWNAVDAANQDLLCYTVSESAITAKTDVITNATDDCGLAAICLDLVDGVWTVFNAGKADGSETWSSAVKFYMRQSKDSGATWGPETLISQYVLDTAWCCTIPRMYLGGRQPPLQYRSNVSSIDQININTFTLRPSADGGFF